MALSVGSSVRPSSKYFQKVLKSGIVGRFSKNFEKLKTEVLKVINQLYNMTKLILLDSVLQEVMMGDIQIANCLI